MKANELKEGMRVYLKFYRNDWMFPENRRYATILSTNIFRVGEKDWVALAGKKDVPPFFGELSLLVKDESDV